MDVKSDSNPFPAGGDPSKIIFIFELRKSFFDEFITSVISFDSYAMQYDVYFIK